MAIPLSNQTRTFHLEVTGEVTTGPFATLEEAQAAAVRFLNDPSRILRIEWFAGVDTISWEYDHYEKEWVRILG